MSWLRVGDNAATDRRVLELGALAGADDRTVNEAFGFFLRLATYSAAHNTDYVVDAGTVTLLGGARGAVLVEQLRKVGLVSSVRGGRSRRWRLVNDDPDFLHMRLADELEWERQRKRDQSNPRLIIPVRVRDGDGCRYCGSVVQWTARKGDRRGCYDHREPGRPARVDTYVVSCFSCNRARSNRPNADEDVPLLPVPAQPYYSDYSINQLARHGVTVLNSRPDLTPDPARTTSDPGDARAPLSRPGPTPDPAHDRPVRSGQVQPGPRSSARVGSGRVGSGRVGTPLVPVPPPTGSPDPAARRRRGRRRRPSTPGDVP